jgi:hypothetical protein
MITIKIKTSNAAFQDGNKRTEVARILRDLASKLESGLSPHKLYDINGNHVGSISPVWNQSE